MKPPRFDYLRPSSLDEALQLLAEEPDESKIIAGGQSLVPMMNFRLARPARLIDIADLDELCGMHTEDGRVVIGARTRHVDLEHTPAVAEPLATMLVTTAKLIGHAPIRTRGTFGGSICHADTTSEWCNLAVLLDARMHLASVRGDRWVPASEFFETVFTTVMEPDEILTAVSLPELTPDHVLGVAEFSRRAGDFAIVVAMTCVRLDDGVVSEAAISLGGIHAVAWRCDAAEAALVGQPLTRASLAAAAEIAASDARPSADVHGDEEYRRDLIRALVPRTLDHHLPGGEM